MRKRIRKFSNENKNSGAEKLPRCKVVTIFRVISRGICHGKTHEKAEKPLFEQRNNTAAFCDNHGILRKATVSVGLLKKET